MPKLTNNTEQSKAVRAIHPNSGVEAWYAQRLRQLLQDALTDAVGFITSAWNAAPPTVGIAMDAGIVYYPPREEYRYREDDDTKIDESSIRWVPGEWRPAYDAPSSTIRINNALKKWGEKWRGKFDKLSDQISKQFSDRAFSATDVAMKAALKEAGFTVSFRPTRKSLESYKLVVAENVGLIRNLQASFYNKIQQDTWAAVRAGSDLHTLSAKLQQSYGIEEKRAALIARDQNAKAKAVIETTRRQELGIRQAIWQHSAGGKEPRPIHIAWGREGTIFDLDKGLYDPEENEWVFPGQLINCRCTSRAIIPGITDKRRRR